MSIGLPFLTSDDRPPCMANPHLFHDDEYVPDDIPEGLSSRSRQAEQQRSQRVQVRKVCNECPFQSECAEYAIVHERDGWWAGLSPKDREDIRKVRGVAVQIPRMQPSGGPDWVPSLRKQQEQQSQARLWRRDLSEQGREKMQAYNARKVTA